MPLLLFVFFVNAACDSNVGPLPPVAAEREPAIRPVAGIPDLPAELAAALSAGNPVVLGDTRLPRLADLSESERRGWATIFPDSFDACVAAFLFLQVGTPYALGPMGEEAPPDTDPVISYKSVDCVTLNLTSWAAAMSYGADNERAAMIRAHYRHGVVSFENRFHFSSDRLDHSPMNREITARVGGAMVKSQRMILNRKPDGARWIPIEWERERVMRWIPWSAASRIPYWRRDGRIPELTGIVFVKSSLFEKGLDALHEGNIWQGNTIIHASSRYGRVVAQRWEDFIREAGNRYDGFLLFEYRRDDAPIR
jgi:hypothetical protein